MGSKSRLLGTTRHKIRNSRSIRVVKSDWKKTSNEILERQSHCNHVVASIKKGVCFPTQNLRADLQSSGGTWRPRRWRPVCSPRSTMWPTSPTLSTARWAGPTVSLLDKAARERLFHPLWTGDILSEGAMGRM